jgi:flagellar FliL protein
VASNSNQDDGIPAAGGTTADFVKSALVAVLLGVGGGGVFGYFAIPDVPAPAVQSTSKSTEQQAPSRGRFPDDALEVEVPSVIGDLETVPKIRVRLDVSIIVAHGTPETTTLKGEVREDVLAYLKGLTVADIQGVRGFQNLREQLDDRARIRGRGAILGLLIGGLVLE